MRFTYLVFGISAGITAMLYMAIYHLFLVKIERKREATHVDHPGAFLIFRYQEKETFTFLS